MDRYSRQTIYGPIGEAGQDNLRRARALVVGCGALGTHAAELLARAGVGSIRLVDRDLVEWSNLHRQGAFEEAHARDGTPKAEALGGFLRRINSEVEVDVRVAEMRPGNVLDLADACDLLLDGTDNLPARFLLNDASLRLRVPWVYAGAVGGVAHVQLFAGTGAPCLRCQLPELPPAGTIATCDTAGVIGPAAALAASWQAALALRYLATRDLSGLEGRKAILEPWAVLARVVRVEADPDCTVCVRRTLDALSGHDSERAAALCGRDAVQVRPAADGAPFDLARAAGRLERLGPVERRERFLRFQAGNSITLTLFDDGRAIFDGLTDLGQARSLYARLVGQ